MDMVVYFFDTLFNQSLKIFVFMLIKHDSKEFYFGVHFQVTVAVQNKLLCFLYNFYNFSTFL